MDEKLAHILNHVARLSGQNPEFRRALCEKLRIKETAPVSSPTKGKETEGDRSDSAPVFPSALSQDDIAGLSEFRSALQQSRRQNGQPTSRFLSSFTLAPDNAADLRVLCTALQLRGRPSVDYSFVTDARVRDQLLADNLRMENAALMTRRDLLLVTHERCSPDDEVLLGEHTRLDLFAIAAFNQLECLTNWFLAWKYPDIDELIEAIEEATKTAGYPWKALYGRKLPTSVSIIDVQVKFNALVGMFKLEDEKVGLYGLRKLRNICIHRVDPVNKTKYEKFNLFDYYEYNSFDTIRTLLNRVVEAVRKDIDEQLQAKKKGREVERRKLAEQGIHTARVVLKSSGYCQLYVNEVGKKMVPTDLLPKMDKQKVGDVVQVKITDDKITGIEIYLC